MSEFVTAPLQKNPWWKRPWGIVLILSVTLFLVFGAWFSWLVFVNLRQIRSGQLKPLTDFSTKFTVDKATGKRVPNVKPDLSQQLIRSDSAYHGDANAQITIVEFGDFECPYTQQEFPFIRPFIESHPEVKFVFRNFPLTDIHSFAFRTAEAAQCSNDQGKYWAFTDQVFLNQSDLSDAALSRYAKIVGMNVEQFDTCLKTEKHKALVQRDMQDGAALGVRGTPTFFVNGIMIEGVIPVDAWDEIYKRLQK